MLFNVINYDNQIIGQVEAKDAVEAWSDAGKKYENILDIREVEGQKILRKRIGGIGIQERKTLEEEFDRLYNEFFEEVFDNLQEWQKDRLERLIRYLLLDELLWGESPNAWMNYWPKDKAYLRLKGRDLWGKIENDYIILYHGTTRKNILGIMNLGLLPQYGATEEEMAEMSEHLRKAVKYGVWFATTPYAAFIRGGEGLVSQILQVRIPINWLYGLDEAGFYVQRPIPANMIQRVITSMEWTGVELEEENGAEMP